MTSNTHMKVYSHFANLLNYPSPDIVSQALACADFLAQDYPEASEQIRGFVDSAEDVPLGRLEEIYTGTFDVNPTCFIFAGYMLFGESFNRGKFLVRLQKEYKKRDFDKGNELADHLALMFSFLSILEPNELLAQQLIRDCFLPVISKMFETFSEDADKLNPYRQVLQAILSVLETEKTLVETIPEESYALEGK